jgi:hypothetical protein
MAGEKENNNDLVLSYLYLRRIVGILGFAFPIVLALGAVIFGDCKGFQDSISDYHNVNMRDVFVGLFSAISLFLFVYSGYDKLDSFMAKSAGILGFMVCIFPDDIDNNPCAIQVDQNIPGWFDKVHFTSAVLFFLVLAYFSIFLFTKSKKDNPPGFQSKSVAWLAWFSIKRFFQKQRPAVQAEEKAENTKEKEKRNKIYRWCGYIIILCLLALAVFFIITHITGKRPDITIFGIPFVYSLETIALWSFAFSWFVKGKTILKD